MKLLSKISCLILFINSFHLFSQTIDSNGWTKLNPENASKIIYVSSEEGDDDSAEVYVHTDGVVGADPFLPSASIKAFKTVKAALTNVTNGEAAWILLKRGNTFTETLEPKSGASATAPFVYATYGTSKELPLILLDGKIGFRSLGELNHFYVIGIDFYAKKSDPNDIEFTSFKGNIPGFFIYAASAGTVNDVLVEGCAFRFTEGCNISSKELGGVTNIRLRRNLFFDSYAADSHSSGIFTNQVNDITLEENIFDHNGWYQKSLAGNNDQNGGQATIFNHNLYFSSVKNTVFDGNSFYRPSSIGTKFTANKGEGSSTDITITNNFYYDCEIGISLGGNVRTGAYRFKNLLVNDNVFNSLGESKQTNRTLGWAIEIDDWENGIFKDNFIVHQNVNEASHFGVGMYLRGENKDVQIENNTLYNLKSTNYIYLDRSEFTNSTLSDNIVHNTHDRSKHVFVNRTFTSEDLVFSGNTYSGQSTIPSLYIERDLQSIADWKDKTSEEVTNTTLPNYVDPDRSFERYITEVLGLDSLEAFYKNLRKLNMHNWKNEYTAIEINRWIKEGFEINTGVTVAVTSVTFNEDQENIAIEKNKELQLFPIIQPTNATNKNVTWTSSDESIATVDATGKLTFLTTGSVTIKAVTEDGGFKAESNITVLAEADNTVAVTGVFVAEEQKFLTIDQGSELLLLPPIIRPSNAINKNYIWSSSDESIATIDANGLVKALAVGEVILSVTTEEGGFTATVKMIITPKINDTTFQEFVYKQTDGKDVSLRVYYPESWTNTDNRKAIVMFHGGSWVSGSYFQMFPWCNYLASQGMVAISVSYTYGSVESCVLDARSAMRWVRSNSDMLGIDPNEISAAGASAGSHIAMSTFLSEGLDDPNDDLSVSSKPNAFFLIDPAIKIPTDDYNEIKADWGEEIAKLTDPISHKVYGSDFPPVICFSGTNDGRVSEAHQMVQYLHYKGVPASLWLGSEQVHGFADKSEWFASIMNRIHNFFNDQGILSNAYPLEIKNPKLTFHDFAGDKEGLFSPASILSFPTEKDPSIANNLINNTGFSTSDITPGTPHDEDESNMWFTERGNTSGEIIFDLGEAKDIDQVHLWNWNSPAQSVKTGLRDIEIYTSTTDDIDDFTYATKIAIYPGGNFAQNFDVKKEGVRLVKFAVLNPFNSAFQSMGLAEVKFSGAQSTLSVTEDVIEKSNIPILKYNIGDGRLVIHNNYLLKLQTIDVVDVSGALIRTIKLIDGYGSIEGLSSGMYYLRFKNDSKEAVAVEKYIKN
ncbi:Ig-like domain-containing protein [uncultured Tenacibaculum sp.]|uniref:Ig-like domain-containing protein n=1 Tax=uncultured Tenacibaculum sp. TaxID=174713 RepID=UPI00261A54C0|nr:Ig-like domain-containing protein [uncultured Tenacibaculum sp.]